MTKPPVETSVIDKIRNGMESVVIIIMSKAFFVIFALLLAGCATGSKTRMATRPPDCKVTQLTNDTFRIELPPKSRHSRDAEDYALLCAAKVSMEHDFPYFAIVDIEKVARTDAVAASTNPAKTSAKVFGIYGVGGGSPYRGVSVQTASSEITVQCFPDATADVRASNAKNIRAAIEQKYGLDLASL
ncbi:MAG: hypothetical protein M3O82_04190, partial [Verrucomicrobiota bacterium]|nr:hypothetical protein [Verrucomicrobiota bacterium]